LSDYIRPARLSLLPAELLHDSADCPRVSPQPLSFKEIQNVRDWQPTQGVAQGVLTNLAGLHRELNDSRSDGINMATSGFDPFGEVPEEYSIAPVDRV